jgi:hypothetical protein
MVNKGEITNVSRRSFQHSLTANPSVQFQQHASYTMKRDAASSTSQQTTYLLGGVLDKVGEKVSNHICSKGSSYGHDETANSTTNTPFGSSRCCGRFGTACHDVSRQVQDGVGGTLEQHGKSRSQVDYSQDAIAKFVWSKGMFL